MGAPGQIAHLQELHIHWQWLFLTELGSFLTKLAEGALPRLRVLWLSVGPKWDAADFLAWLSTSAFAV